MKKILNTIFYFFISAFSVSDNSVLMVQSSMPDKNPMDTILFAAIIRHLI